ncbi:hypothetical protein BN1110_04653 [bacterium YEK0313]|nr:hypothetical protein BN1110_04653 [bacterium YEK0313]
MSALPRLALGFVAGALSILIFREATVFGLNQIGVTQMAVYAWRSAPPLGLPLIVNQCFWGGLWGILFVLLWDRSGFQGGGGLAAAFFGLAAGILAWGAASLVFADIKAVAIGVVAGGLLAGLILLFGSAILFGLMFGILGPAVLGWVVMPMVRSQTLFGGRVAVTVAIEGMFGIGLAVLLSLVARFAGSRS